VTRFLACKSRENRARMNGFIKKTISEFTMARILLRIFSAAFGLLISPHDLIFAQVTQSSIGTCSPNIANVTGTIRFTFSCDSLIVERYIYRIDDTQAGILATHYNVTVLAVRNFLQEMTGQNVPPYEVPQKLSELITRVKSLEERIKSISADSTLATDFSELRALLDNGNLDAAEQLEQIPTDFTHSLRA
jgi:hypothetical protein